MDHIAVAGISTSCAAIFTHGIETVKIRMQVQGELQSKTRDLVYRNPFQSFRYILKHEGVRGIQRGLIAGMAYQFLMNGTRLGMFDILKKDEQSFLRNLGVGCLSGALGAFVGSPMYLIKIRMQTFSPQNPVGIQHNYPNLIFGIREILKDGGIKSLWKGSQAAMLRVSIGGGTQISVYSSLKPQIQKIIHSDGLLSSLAAGFFVTLTMNPVDVVATRLYNQRGYQLYSGITDCIFKITKYEGILGFYKGFLAHYFRLGPHTILTFVIWEQMKKLIL